MNSAVASIAIGTLALLLPWAVQAQDPGAGAKVRIGVSAFDKQSGDARFAALERGIPAILEVALLADERVQVFGPDDISGRLERAGLSAALSLRQQSITNEAARALSSEFILEGSFLEFRGEIMITATLIDLRTGKANKLDLVRADSKSLTAQVSALADAVRAAALSGVPGIGSQGVAIAASCFLDESPSRTPVSGTMRRDLALALTQRFSARKGLRVVAWQEVEQACEDKAGLRALAGRLGVEALVSGTLKVKDGAVEVVPTLYDRKDGMRVDLRAVHGTVGAYAKLKAELGAMIEEAVEGALAGDGKWKLAELAGRVNPEQDFRHGKEFLDRGDLELAAVHLERAAASRSVPDAHLQLGILKARQGKFDEAAANLERFVALRRDSAQGRHELGLAYAGQRHYDKSIATLEEALRLAPARHGLHVDIGNAYLFQAKFDEARRYYRRALELLPDDSAAHFNLGLVAQREGKEDEAIEHHRNVLRLKPQDAAARQTLASLFKKKGYAAIDKDQFEAAVAHFSEAIRHRADADAHFGRAYAGSYVAGRSAARDYAAAVGDYEAVLKLSRSTAEARYRRPTLLNLPEAYILARRYGEARSASLNAVREFQNDARDRHIARYLLVISQLLQGEDHKVELELLRRERADANGTLGEWDFKLLEQAFEQAPGIDDRLRREALRITEEFKKSGIRGKG